MVDVLPARASGYPWINIYSSEKHGFSLHTFYRFVVHIFAVILVNRRNFGCIF